MIPLSHSHLFPVWNAPVSHSWWQQLVFYGNLCPKHQEDAPGTKITHTNQRVYPVSIYFLTTRNSEKVETFILRRQQDLPHPRSGTQLDLRDRSGYWHMPVFGLASGHVFLFSLMRMCIKWCCLRRELGNDPWWLLMIPFPCIYIYIFYLYLYRYVYLISKSNIYIQYLNQYLHIYIYIYI